MKRRVTLKRRNPAAAIVRRLSSKRIPSAKAYRRHEKHKSRPDVHNRDGFINFCVKKVSHRGHRGFTEIT